MANKIKLGKGSNNRITITMSYNPWYILKLKTIPGYYWHLHDKYWSFPHEGDNLEKILSIFDEKDIEVDPSLITEKYRTLEDLRKGCKRSFTQT